MHDKSTLVGLPMPNERFGDSIVVASCWLKDDEEPYLCLLLLLNPASPYYTVAQFVMVDLDIPQRSATASFVGRWKALGDPTGLPNAIVTELDRLPAGERRKVTEGAGFMYGRIVAAIEDYKSSGSPVSGQTVDTISSFSDVHGFWDANEFVLEACALFGIDNGVSASTAANHRELDERLKYSNLMTLIVDYRLMVRARKMPIGTHMNINEAVADFADSGGGA